MRKINDTDKQIISNMLQQDVLNMPIVISYIETKTIIRKLLNLLSILYHY